MGALRTISEEVKKDDEPVRQRYSFEESSSDDGMTVTRLPVQANCSKASFGNTVSIVGPFYSSKQLAQIDIEDNTEDETVAKEQLDSYESDTFESSSILQQLPAKQRYYNTALSQEDTQALAAGELNHNLRQYGMADIKALKDFRGTLSQHTSSSNPTEPEKPELSKRQSTVSEPASRYSSWNRGSYLSVNTSLGVKAPVPLQRGRLAVASISPLSPLGLYEPRRASTGDYFSQTHHHRARHSRSSSRIVSPLSFEQRTYRAQPHVTFDSMLAPHISGKGESFRGSSNAMKNDIMGTDEREEEVKSQTARKRLSKMRSVPVMLSRRSRDQDNRNSA